MVGPGLVLGIGLGLVKRQASVLFKDGPLLRAHVLFCCGLFNILGIYQGPCIRGPFPLEKISGIGILYRFPVFFEGGTHGSYGLCFFGLLGFMEIRKLLLCVRFVGQGFLLCRLQGLCIECVWGYVREMLKSIAGCCRSAFRYWIWGIEFGVARKFNCGIGLGPAAPGKLARLTKANRRAGKKFARAYLLPHSW